MGTEQKQVAPKADTAQFMTTEILHNEPIKLRHDGVGEVELVKQRRRRKSDGKFGREFLCVLVKTGRHPVSYDPPVARQLHAALGAMLEKMDLEEKKEHAERAQAKREWEERLASGGNADRTTRSTGKTQRKRDNRAAAGKPTDHAARKSAKAANSAAVRAAAQGMKKGKG